MNLRSLEHRERNLYDKLNHPPHRIEIVQPSRESRQLVKTRLFFVYDFIRDHLKGKLPQKSSLLDIGTYDGFGIPTLLQTAGHVTSIDLNEKNLFRAHRRLAGPITEGRVTLRHKSAQKLRYKEKFDAVTIVEVFGDGFKGTKKDIEQVVTKAHDALKPGGYLVLTLGSKTYDKYRADQKKFSDKQGKVTAYRRDVSPALKRLFKPENITWYGQGFLDIENGHPKDKTATIKREKGSVGLHSGEGQVLFSADRYKVRQARPGKAQWFETPRHWVGVCQKPLSPLPQRSS